MPRGVYKHKSMTLVQKRKLAEISWNHHHQVKKIWEMKNEE
jgi:hypothetical protein